MDDNQDEQLKTTTCRLLLEEQRRDYDSINSKFHGLRNRILTFLAVELTALAYFFADLKTIIPEELYGIIFFTIGIVCLMSSVGLFFYCYRSIHNWPVPVGPVEILQIHHSQSESDVLDIITTDYMKANEEASRIFSRHAKFSNWGLYLFVSGVIILLIIKFF